MLSAETHLDTNLSLFLRVVLGIAVLAVCGTSSSYVPPRWCRMANFPCIYADFIDIKISSYWLVWNDCKDARLFFMFCS